MHANFPLSPAIAQTFQQLRRLLRRYIAAQGLLWLALWLMVTFWLGGLIDYVPVRLGSNESPTWLRAGLLTVMFVGSGWILYRWIVARLWVKLADPSLALLIERHYPEMNNELITAVELSRGVAKAEVGNSGAHQAMLDRVHQSAAGRIQTVQPADLFDWQPLWAIGIAAAFGLALTAVAVVGLPDWTGRWARRLFALTDEAWPRRAALRADGLLVQIPSFSTQLSAQRVLLPFQDGAVRVPQGATPQLQIAADAQAQQIPDVCTLFYRADDGARGRANLRRIGSPRDNWQSFTLDGPPLDGLTQAMSLDVVGLDARLRDLRIEVVEPAVVSRMQLACSYPGYLLDSLSVRGQKETLEYRSGLTIPEGTSVNLVGTASQPLSRVDYVILSADQDESPSETTILTSQPENNRFVLPLGELKASQVVEVRLIDQFGLSAEQIPRYVVTMRKDTAPEVNTRLEGIGLAITPQAMLPIAGTVEDDHGIQQVTAEIAVDEGQPLALPLELRGQELSATVDLKALAEQQQLTLAPGMNLGLLIQAQDYYNLGEKPHVGRGQLLQLSVVTADQLLVTLDRQELEQRQRLELIIAELQQLQQVLQTLKTDLPPTQSSNVTPHSIDKGGAGWVTAFQNEPRETPAQTAQRLAGLWAQQSVLQGEKSQQELASLAARVENLRLQLVNNRVDSYDRQQRLQEKISQPLRALLSGPYLQLQQSLANLQTAALAGGGREPADQAFQDLQAVLLKLEEIKANMQDIEDFNEIVDLVRGLLEDQEKLLQETEQQQRQRILDLLR